MAVWEQQFDTQCRIRRAVIVHGNVQDVFWDESSGTIGSSISVHLQRRLEALGYADVVRWNPHGGASAATDRDSTRSALAEMVREAAVGVGPATAAPKTTGQAYDLGPSAAVGTESDPAGPDPATALKTPASFFSALLRRFRSDHAGRPMAFLVDGGDVLFGDSRSLSESERELLLLLSQTLRESKCSLDSKALSAAEDILVLVTPKLGFIPPRFYQDNPAVSDVAVPLPERTDREAFLRRLGPSLLVRESIRPGTRDFADLVDALDGFSFREMQQLARLSRRLSEESGTTPAPFPWRQLVRRYRYGQSSSPWEELDRRKLATLEQTLREQVKGQDHVIGRIRDVIVSAYMGLSGLQHSARRQRPKGIFFFVGPTGVGKTETAKALARFLFGDEEACIRFDMSEYSAEHSDQRLVGAPPGYVGYEEGGQLTNAVRRRPGQQGRHRLLLRVRHRLHLESRREQGRAGRSGTGREVRRGGPAPLPGHDQPSRAAQPHRRREHPSVPFSFRRDGPSLDTRLEAQAHPREAPGAVERRTFVPGRGCRDEGRPSGLRCPERRPRRREPPQRAHH